MASTPPESSSWADPRRGKSTIARALREERGIPTLCGDPRSKVKDPEDGVEYAPEDLEWSENSQYIAEAWLLCRPGPWCAEGVAMARALRKVAAAGKADDLAGMPIVFIANAAPGADPTEGQERMAKAVLTVWLEIAEDLPDVHHLLWRDAQLTS